MNEKCRRVLQITVIFLFFVLFIFSFIYTLAVYFSIKEKPVKVCFLHVIGGNYIYSYYTCHYKTGILLSQIACNFCCTLYEQ